MAVLKEGEAGVPIAEIIRKHGISRHTYFNWKRKYAGATVADLRRLRELEAENAKLKRMYTDLALENARPHDSLGRVPPLTFLPRPTSIREYAFNLST